MIRTTMAETASLLSIFLLWGSAAASAQDASDQATQIDRYGFYEAALSADGEYANPYTEVDAEAVLTLPDGSERTLPLFWDGGDVWRLRISPHVGGSWSFAVRSSDSGLDGQRGTFACVASQLPGGIERMEGFSSHFQRQDGTPFLFWGDTAWGLYLDREDERLGRGAALRYIDARAEQGVNAIHSMLLSEAGWGNAGGAAFTDLAAETLNPAYWQEIDTRLRHLNDRGIVGGLVLAWALKGNNPLSWQDFPSMEARRRYIRYIAGRYGGFDTYFIVAGEWNLRDRRRSEQLEQLREQYQQMGQWLDEADAHERMLGIHPGFGTVREWDEAAWTDFGDYQQNYPRVHREIVESRREVEGPVVNSEYGYLFRDSDGNGHPDKDNSLSVEDMRYATWDIVMGGGYPITGYATTYMGGYRDKGPFNVGDARNDPWEQQYQHVKNFVGGTQWWKLRPDDEAIAAAVPRSEDRTIDQPSKSGGTIRILRPPAVAYWMLSDPGRTYVAYARGVDGELTIRFDDGEYAAELFDPRTGELKGLPNRIDAGSGYRWTPPDASDWALRLIRQ